MDSIYNSAIVEAPESIKDEVLFLIAKDALLGAYKSSDSLLQRFSTGCKTQSYLSYISNLKFRKELANKRVDVLIKNDNSTIDHEKVINSLKGKII